MGIKNLSKVILKFAPNSIKYKKIENYKNRIIGIDTNLMAYKMIYAIRKNGYDLKNKEIVVTHIHGIIQKLVAFKIYNITPIFVFDGIPPSIKEKTLRERKVFKDFMEQKYLTAVTQDEKKKYYFMKSDITAQELDEISELIDIFGYNIIDSKEEADSQLASLSKDGIIDSVATDDLDILIFGGRLVLKNFTVSPEKKIQEINLQKLLKELSLTQEQLIDIGILLGCDYCPTVKGIGPVNSYKLIKKYGSIDNLVEEGIIKLNLNYKKVKAYFLNPKIEKYSTEIIRNDPLDYQRLDEFLKKYGYDEKYVKNIRDLIIHNVKDLPGL